MPEQLSFIPKDDELVTVTQAAESLGYSKMTIYRWFRSKRIGGMMIAGFLFILKSEVNRLETKRAPLSKGALSSKIGGER